MANGTAPLTYQWQKNGTNIAGVTSASYTTSATTTSDSGSTFDVVVSNSAGPATSNPATLTVNTAAVAPAITTQPANQTVTAGQTATFSVAASGTAPLSYQWKKNGTAVSGATSASYTTPASSSSDNGALFNVVVSNASGSVTSNIATLTVNAASATLQVTTTQLAGATLSGAYSATLSASGGTTPYAWSLASGSLPTGLTLSSAGTISGTPTSAGSFPFTVQVTDTASHSASANLSVNVGNPVVSVAIASPANNATVSGSVTVSGTASDTVSVSSVQVSVDNGAYSNASGTTNWSYSFNTASLSNGSHTLTAKATDAAGLFAISSVLNISVSNGSSASDCTLFRSEEHTSELQSRGHLVCRLLLEKKKRQHTAHHEHTRHE